MYKISVPVDNSNLSDIGREKTLSELKKVGAERVFLAIHKYETDTFGRDCMIADLKENSRIFQPIVELGDNYDAVEFIGCTGNLEGNRVTLSEIAPYGFAAFVAKKS